MFLVDFFLLFQTLGLYLCFLLKINDMQDAILEGAQPTKKSYAKSVKFWLFIGVFMVVCQVIIGGITRLTDSGLSITEWAVIQGTIPPLSEGEWETARQAYIQRAVGQVQMKWPTSMYPDGIPMSEFKFIFFWEYFHRLWARSMGFVFLIPFLFFWRRKMLSKPLMRELGKVVGIAAVVALFGWIMVKSGLDTPQYAWVNGYKLTLHLSLATILLGYLWWTTLKVWQPETTDGHNSRLRKFAWRITVIIGLQIVLGGLMAGIKAGLFFNYFPHMQVDPDGSWVWIAEVLKEQNQWSLENMQNYNTNAFAPAIVQLMHRGTAYLLCLLIPIFYFNVRRIHQSKLLERGSVLLLLILIIQVTLGILTLLFSVGKIPLFWGVAHQAGGLLLLVAMLFVNYQFSNGGDKLAMK
jgi:cytochrome c oxidase assembly protein subunit 15